MLSHGYWLDVVGAALCNFSRVRRCGVLLGGPGLSGIFVIRAAALWHGENDLVCVLASLLLRQPSLRRALNVLHLQHLLPIHLSFLL